MLTQAFKFIATCRVPFELAQRGLQYQLIVNHQHSSNGLHAAGVSRKPFGVSTKLQDVSCPQEDPVDNVTP